MPHRKRKHIPAPLPQPRKSPLMDLFPAITPYSSGFLSVDDTHNLYWEQSGNPDGVPIILLHGGPGAGASPTHRRFFDPDYYRIIIFDQRGAGRSTPLGSLENNTTQHLVDDIEKLRAHFGIDHWHVFGGSWGSTLALAYAIEHPDVCKSIIMRGIFLCEDEEIHWFLYGMRTIFPEAWEQFTAILDENELDDILTAYHKRLTSDDEDVQMQAAIRWALYESACSSLLPNYETITTDEQKAQSLALARLECHYFFTQAYRGKHKLTNHLDKIRHIPTSIIQGRYDVICPIVTANRLHQLWPEADYVVVPDSGHSSMDPTLRSRLIEATENAKTIS